MIKTLRQIINMKAILWVNAFCFYFSRLWLVGKWMPDSLYSRYGLKRKLSILAVVARQVWDFCGKPLYLLFAVGLPLLMMPKSGLGEEGAAFAAMVQILFFLNGVLGAFGDSQIFTVTRDKVTCIRYLHMDARAYLQGCLALKYVPFFLYYLIWLLPVSLLLGGTLLQGFFLWLMLLSFRMMGEAFQLLVFDHTGKVLSRNMVYEWLMIGIGLTGAYLPILTGLNWLPAERLLHPLCVAACVLLGAAALRFITVGYRGYEGKFRQTMDLNYLLSSVIRVSTGSTAAFKEVEMREKDAVISAAAKEKFNSLSGYSYLNALFFARHRRQLVKPVCYRLIAAAALFAGAGIFRGMNREAAVQLSENLTAMLPFFVYIMYFMTVADKASHAMFYNCDKDLLRYAYYRQPRTILTNFRIRLVRVSLYDLAVAGTVCLAAMGFCLLCGTGIFTVDMVLFCLTILLLSVLFTVHHLCLYYIFQPYSESLRVKNPFYSVINGAMYVICFLCLQIEAGGFVFTMAVLAFTVIYIAGALVLVYYRAPKSFRVK